MVFTKKQPVIVYLTENSVRLYEGEEQVKTIALTPKKSEMRKVLKKLFEEEFPTEFRRREMLVVLGGKLLYQKAYLLSEETVGEEDKEAFYVDLPIESEDLARNTITTEHKVYLLGTDKSYYEALLDICENVLYVLPLSLFTDDTLVDELTREQREDIYKNISLYEVGDFLSDNPFTPSGEESASESSPTEQIVVTESSFNVAGLMKLIALSLVIGAVFFGGFVFLDQQNGGTSKEQKETPLTPIPSVVEEEAKVTKEELTIQIFNGTGTAGEAGAVESLLTEADFSNIEIGNAESQDNTVTEVLVSSQVNQTIQEELKEVLESYFSEVEITQVDEEADFDIVITTGTAEE